MIFLRTDRGTSTMVIGIGHYGQNITLAEAKMGCIKSPNIIDERGAVFYGKKAREYPTKTRQTTEL